MRTLNLNYEGFENYLVEKTGKIDGIAYRFRFENGYGASVIKHQYSYGNERDLWELAVIEWFSDDIFDLCYDTDITDDVIGYLTDSEVRDLMNRIKGL